ncbi:MAG: putative sulfate exporter family transporter, partial [Acidimicrobiia bacterium]|nr:putative sulfate exporter family transporter [Acidimicrobiia bacterium]
MASEDWLAVWLGGLSIALVLAGFEPARPVFDWSSAAELAGSVLTPANLAAVLRAGAALGILAAGAIYLLRGSLRRFAPGFTVTFLLAVAALTLAGNTTVSAWGVEYVIFAFALGLLVGNTIQVPAWLREAARSEFYIKIGLVISGTTIVFRDLVQAGALGLLQALAVVTVVWGICFWLARRLRVDDEFGAMLATAVSICGVSAAIAACGAIRGDRRKLSYVTSLVLIVAAPMMVVMPHLVRIFDIPDVVGGAWLGGTLDTSASVVAAGEMVSEAARNAAVVVKVSQNVLIGV